MVRKRFAAEEIIRKLRETEVALEKGLNVEQVVKPLGVTVQACWPDGDERS